MMKRAPALEEVDDEFNLENIYFTTFRSIGASSGIKIKIKLLKDSGRMAFYNKIMCEKSKEHSEIK
jgi:hypothetical protein